VYFFLAHAEDRTVHIDIFPAGQLLMKAGADFQQRRYPSAHLDLPGGGIGDLGKNFQERALPRPVSTDNAHGLAAPRSSPPAIGYGETTISSGRPALHAVSWRDWHGQSDTASKAVLRGLRRSWANLQSLRSNHIRETLLRLLKVI